MARALKCAPATPKAARASHDSPRTPNAHISGPCASKNTTTTAHNYGPPTLRPSRPPSFGARPFGPSTFSLGAPGPHPSGSGPNLRGPTLGGAGSKGTPVHSSSPSPSEGTQGSGDPSPQSPGERRGQLIPLNPYARSLRPNCSKLHDARGRFSTTKQYSTIQGCVHTAKCLHRGRLSNFSHDNHYNTH